MLDVPNFDRLDEEGKTKAAEALQNKDWTTLYNLTREYRIAKLCSSCPFDAEKFKLWWQLAKTKNII